ncbi:glycosyl hydrolase [Aspergillus pseudoustus]|uniref:Glycosyl hydrolase n=1 Tax=Aspergillus pseudoustus TaxID=1810923 RepID=A0ABR4IRG0_9EURO
MTYRNPIIPGFAPDPSIVRIHDMFYLVTSSFHLFPGLPIYASRDLIAWRHIGNAIHRPTQLSLARSSTKLNPLDNGSGEKAPATGGLYAPTIRHYNGKTYIVCTNVVYDPGRDKGDWASGLTFQNFIVSTADIGIGVWSDPVFFEYHGIDPDLFVDDDGRAYLAGSAWTPSPSCCINCFEIDLQTGQKLGEEKILWHGYTKVIPEGPHIYKRNGSYYLLVAEGGTHEGHCLTVARAPTIWGPYETCDHNPILQPTTTLDPSAYCQYNGHGDLVQDLQGNWWMVCLAVRRDRAGRMVLGRETFLTAVYWPEGQIWPQIQQPIPRTSRRRLGNGDSEEGLSMSPPIEAVPSPFDPKMDLVCIRDPDPGRSKISSDGRTISLVPLPTELGQCTGEPTAFVGRRQRRLEGSATADLALTSLSAATEVKMGMAYYKDEHRYARIMYEPGHGTLAFEVKNGAKDPPISREKRADVHFLRATKLQFRVLYTGQFIHFMYRVEQAGERSGWNSFGLIDTLDMSSRDFTGPVIGVFAVGAGEEWCTFEDVDI